MNYTSLASNLRWRTVKPSVGGSSFGGPPSDDDSREATFVENLEPEWIHALESADYSHLHSKLKKQPA